MAKKTDKQSELKKALREYEKLLKESERKQQQAREKKEKEVIEMNKMVLRLSKKFFKPVMNSILPLLKKRGHEFDVEIFAPKSDGFYYSILFHLNEGDDSFRITLYPDYKTRMVCMEVYPNYEGDKRVEPSERAKKMMPDEFTPVFLQEIFYNGLLKFVAESKRRLVREG